MCLELDMTNLFSGYKVGAFTQYSYDSVLCQCTVIEMLKGFVVRNMPVYGFSFFLVLDIHVRRVFPR